ncbi:DUF4349 domain-containing protein [Alicyclobacillus dauci]|uniref:DUF4349 domain-containing protein n=1 Tax=Alicyclobacillus dauci TaxID=1475485 RepID=A0ABY6Z6A1_9BACL|nr:DUF4349 domain-containing protein [Alicyclobacillus dauci]WAH37799.1 DUF4349 domain-containing protein [Alicyclobacillus dauci]
MSIQQSGSQQNRLFFRIRSRPWILVITTIMVLAGGGFAVSAGAMHRHSSMSSTSAVGTSTTHSGAYTAVSASSSTTSSTGVAQQAASPKSAASTATAAKSGTGNRDVIETASLSLTVSNVSAASNKITQMTSSYGGFVQSMQTDAGQSQQVQMTVRIPEAKFENFLNGAKPLGTVDQFSQTGQDVTQQHTDLTSQMEELQSEEKAYTKLYDKAQSMKDMLTIQQSLSQVDSQIANLETQIHQLDRSVQLSTVSLTLHQPKVAGTTKQRPVSALAQSLRFMGQSSHGLGIFLAFVLPWVVLAAFVWVGWRAIVRWRNGRRKHNP